MDIFVGHPFFNTKIRINGPVGLYLGLENKKEVESENDTQNDVQD